MHSLVKETYGTTNSSIESQLDWLRQIQYGLKMVNNCSKTCLTSTLFSTTNNQAKLEKWQDKYEIADCLTPQAF